jgi:hypothetical protein
LEFNAREGFEMSRLARGDLAHTLGHRAQLSLLAGVEREQTVGFAKITVTEDDGFCAEGCAGAGG